MSINYKELRLLRRSWDTDTRKPIKQWHKYATMVILTLFILYALYSIAYADNSPTGHINEEIAVACIIGEAEAEGYEGMLAIAYALHARGTTKGVYGCKAPRVLKHKYSYVTYTEASKAWVYAISHPEDDITNGATGWGNSKDLVIFKRTKWWRNCEITARIGKHIFYKQKGS